MAFSRIVAAAPPSDERLTAAMAGIGMNLGVAAAVEPNLEDTIFFASEAAMDRGELRVLAILVTWFGVHASWVNADRLTRLVVAQSSPRVSALWAALARWQGTDRRFSRLAAVRIARVDLLSTGTEFQIRRHGEDPRFAHGPLRVPANVLRDRPADVLSSAELAKRHRAYRWRIVIGPSYRADMWAALESAPTLSAAALARKTYGSFASAWHVRRDFGIVAHAGARRSFRGARRAADPDGAGG